MATERSRSDGVGSSRASISPSTRTGMPITRDASRSNCGRNWLQSMKYGPIRAASSARITAIAKSEQRRLHGVSLWACSGAMAARNGPPAAADLNTGAAPYIIYRGKCGEVTAKSRGGLPRAGFTSWRATV